MHKNDFAQSIGLNAPDLNAERQQVVTQEFLRNKGKRALVLIPQFPFLIIGTIVDVEGDYLQIKAEITNLAEFDGETFNIHIDKIEVFYIERKGRPIPDIRMKKHD